MNLLDSISSGNANVNAIEAQLFNVVKIQLHPNIEGFNSPSAFGIYKDNGGDALGTLGKDFNPTQPKFLLDNLVPCLIDANVDLNKLTYNTFKDDKKISFRAPVKNIEFINKAKLHDITNVFVNLSTGFDGYTKTSLYLSIERLVCLNGMKATRTEFAVSFKNTKGNFGKASAICDDVVKAIEGVTTLEEGFKRLNSVDVKVADVDTFLLKVLGYNRKDYAELNTNKRNIFDRINESLGLEMARSGNTLWGMLNGVTHYTNHIANANDRNDYVYIDSGMKMNEVAQRAVYEMAEM
jgi:hypothetical protein